MKQIGTMRQRITLHRSTRREPDLCIEAYDVRTFEGGRNKGTIHCKQMKCEFPSGNLAKDIGALAQEWLDVREAYL